MHPGITNAAPSPIPLMWGAIPLPLGHDSGKWGTIPLRPKKCPTSQRNPAPHPSGMLPHFKRNPRPTSTGIRTGTDSDHRASLVRQPGSLSGDFANLNWPHLII